MSYSGKVMGFIWPPWRHQHREVKADFTSIYLDRPILLQEIQLGNVTQIKIYIEDLPLVISNVTYLADSLVDLRIRPRTVQFPTDDNGQSRTPDRRSPFDSETLHNHRESFIHSLEKLTKLGYLSLDNDGASAEGLLNSVSKLTEIKFLKLQSCGFRQLDVQLPLCLQTVDLSSNNLSMFPQALLNLQELESLTLCRNRISELPDGIEKLKKLKKLDLSNNQITYIPNSIVKLRSLIKLYMTDNSIKELPIDIGQLTTLSHFELRGNQINSLPDSIGMLCKLVKLNLCNNKLTSLPKTICNLGIDDDALLLSGNPLQLPPAEVCIQGTRAMKGYFHAMDESKGVKCKRIKLILVGESFAGKTSLVHALVHKKDAKVKPDERTVGLDFHRWRPNPQQKDGIEIRLIDCAGQRKYLLTHQFFFTEGAIFLLVLDLSKYEMNDCTYRIMVGDWINLVIGHIPGAVIMIVPTHLDICESRGENVGSKCRDILFRVSAEEQSRVELLEKDHEAFKTEGTDMAKVETIDFLRKTRPHVPSCLYDEDPSGQSISMIPVCSKETLKGIDILQKKILQIASNVTLCPIVNKEVPESWIGLEEELIELKNHGMFPFFKKTLLFSRTAEKHGLSNEMFDSALLYLNAIGSIAYFDCVQGASHLVFINLEWLTRLLQLLFRHDHQQSLIFSNQYAIFPEQFEQDKELFITEGHLSEQLLRCIWHKMLGVLDVNLVSHIVDILKYFDVICELPRKSAMGDIIYFIPWFVVDDKPEKVDKCWTQNQSWEEKDDVVFQMTTSICRLPLSVFDRLLVFAHEQSELCVPWKSGFFIPEQNFYVLCNVQDRSRYSSIKLHGRCRRGFINDVWRFILRIYKKFEVLIKEWSGIIVQRTYSLCPLCVEQNLEHPWMFLIDLSNGCSSNDRVSCRKCLGHCESKCIIPPQEIVEEVFEGNSANVQWPALTAPLSEKELSIFATMLGVEHTKLALNLGLSYEEDVEVARANHQNSQYEQAMELLTKWKQRRGAAIRSELIDAVKQLDTPNSDIIRYLKYGKR